MTTLETLTRSPLTLDDVPELTALINRVDQADDLGEPAEEPSIRELLGVPGVDLSRDSLAVRAGERIVGFVIADVAPAPDRDGRARCQLMGAVDPEHRRAGLGSELFERGEQRAATVAAALHPGVPAVLRAGGGRDPEPAASADVAPGGGADVRAILDRRGYRRVRSWLVMSRELPGAPLPVPALEGARLVAPAETDREATRDAHVDAFADHWGSAPISEDRWNLWWSAHTARRDLSTLAVDADGTVLGYAIAAEDTPGVLHIALVGTRGDMRGRGIARGVITRTLEAAAAAGYARAELEVDAESLTGATRLYDGLGFTRDSVFATYEKPMG